MFLFPAPVLLQKKKLVDAAQALGLKGKKRAKGEVKGEAKGDADENLPKTGHFKGYDLEKMEIPRDAWPTCGKQYQGQNGYTLVSKNNADPFP